MAGGVEVVPWGQAFKDLQKVRRGRMRREGRETLVDDKGGDKERGEKRVRRGLGV